MIRFCDLLIKDENVVQQNTPTATFAMSAA